MLCKATALLNTDLLSGILKLIFFDIFNKNMDMHKKKIRTKYLFVEKEDL